MKSFKEKLIHIHDFMVALIVAILFYITVIIAIPVALIAAFIYDIIFGRTGV